MKTSGKDLRALQDELDVPPAEVAAEAGVSIGTLYNVYADKKVKPTSASRVRNALTKLQLKSKTG